MCLDSGLLAVHVQISLQFDEFQNSSFANLRFSLKAFHPKLVGTSCRSLSDFDKLARWRLSLQNCGESVSSVEGGVVGSAGFDEIIATTYTGWVFGLTTENVESRARLQRDSISSTSTSATTSSSVFDTDNAVKIKLEKLRRELDIIQSRVVEEREK